MSNISPVNFGLYVTSGYYDRRPYPYSESPKKRNDGITDVNGRRPLYDGITNLNRPTFRPYDGITDIRPPRYTGITNLNGPTFRPYDGITDINPSRKRRPVDYFPGWYSSRPPRRSGSYNAGLPALK